MTLFRDYDISVLTAWQPAQAVPAHHRVIADQTAVQKVRDYLGSNSATVEQLTSCANQGKTQLTKKDERGIGIPFSFNADLAYCLHRVTEEGVAHPEIKIPTLGTETNILLGKAFSDTDEASRLSIGNIFSDKPTPVPSVDASISRDELRKEVQGHVDRYSELAKILTPAWANTEAQYFSSILDSTVNFVRSRKAAAQEFLNRLAA